VSDPETDHQRAKLRSTPASFAAGRTGTRKSRTRKLRTAPRWRRSAVAPTSRPRTQRGSFRLPNRHSLAGLSAARLGPLPRTPHLLVGGMMPGRSVRSLALRWRLGRRGNSKPHELRRQPRGFDEGRRRATRSWSSRLQAHRSQSAEERF
jgi:hypothetical protein